MADNFTMPGLNTTYVPTLHEGLLIAYVRNPAKFPINKYINVRKVDKMIGYYTKFQNQDQARVLNSPSNYEWVDGSDAPTIQDGNDPFEFKAWNAHRYAYTKQLGYLGVGQAQWDLINQAATFSVMKGMTNRSYRVAKTISTSGNYLAANVFNASSGSSGGATWGNATSTTPAIRKSVMNAAIAIQKATNAAVEFNDLYLVMNPDTALVVATSQEFIDFLKQNPTSIQLWQGDEQFLKYNIPTRLFGLNVVVDDTVYNSSQPSATVSESASPAYTFPDNTAVLLCKQNAVQSGIGSSFATMEVFAYQDFETFIYADSENQRYNLQVVENVDDSFLWAPESGALINTNA